MSDPIQPEQLNQLFDCLFSRAVAKKVDEAEATIFDPPGFIVVCPRCRRPSKLTDAFVYDPFAYDASCATVIRCPRCNLEAKL